MSPDEMNDFLKSLKREPSAEASVDEKTNLQRKDCSRCID